MSRPRVAAGGPAFRRGNAAGLVPASPILRLYAARYPSTAHSPPFPSSRPLCHQCLMVHHGDVGTTPPALQRVSIITSTRLSRQLTASPSSVDHLTVHLSPSPSSVPRCQQEPATARRLRFTRLGWLRCDVPRLTGRLVAPGSPASRRYIWRCILPTLSQHHPSAPCSLHEPTAACLHRLRHPSPALLRSRSPCRPPPRLPPPRSSLSRWAARHPLLFPSPPSLPMPLPPSPRVCSQLMLSSPTQQLALSSSLAPKLTLSSSHLAARAQQPSRSAARTQQLCGSAACVRESPSRYTLVTLAVHLLATLAVHPLVTFAVHLLATLVVHSLALSWCTPQQLSAPQPTA